MIRVIQRGARRTKEIVQALHNYSRGDDDRLVDFDLQRGIDDSLELLRHHLKNGITVERAVRRRRPRARPRRPAQPGVHEPPDQRRAGARRAARRRHHPHRHRAQATARRSSPSPTTAPASRPRCCRASSIRSSRPRTSARARASACRSCTASSSATAAPSPSTAPSATAPRSPSRCPPSEIGRHHDAGVPRSVFCSVKRAYEPLLQLKREAAVVQLGCRDGDEAVADEIGRCRHRSLRSAARSSCANSSSPLRSASRSWFHVGVASSDWIDRARSRRRRRWRRCTDRAARRTDPSCRPAPCRRRRRDRSACRR